LPRILPKAFPDFEFLPEVIVVDDDYVTLAFRGSGTHQGEFMGHPATGKRFEVRSIQVTRSENGLGVERWGCTDVQGMLRQLGLTSDS
jgi:predicted ester cyclase